MVFTSNSSTSLLAIAATVLAIVLWPLRRHMTLIRRGFWLMLLGLHLAMHAPVWDLIGRIDLTGSSSGYHRQALVDNCIRHFSDWWLIGYRHYEQWGWDMFDLCNQFVVQALIGGLLALVAYIMIFVLSFGAIGRASRKVQGDRRREWFFWCLGSALFSIVVAHFGINYPSEMQIGLFTVWACISVATFEARKPAKANSKIPDNSQLIPDLVGVS